MREVTMPILPCWSEHPWDIPFRARPPCAESSLDGVGSASPACGREHRQFTQWTLGLVGRSSPVLGPGAGVGWVGAWG